MRAMPLNIGTIHFVGIGGIGMSGIAEVLHNLGYKVQGSDQKDGPNTQRLRANGLKIFIGHTQQNVADAAVVVISSAVKNDNPEVRAARKAMIPVVRRAEMLAELMRLKWSIAVGGTHGKTTTTSLIAAMLDAAGLDPTVINGGIINAYGTNSRLGKSDWMVVEADESDGTFTRLPATACVVTNIDPEHMDHYGTEEKLHEAFDQFVSNIPFYGFAALCIDHPEVQALIPRVDRRIVTYGTSPQANVRAINVETGPKGATFDIQISERDAQPVIMKGFVLPMFGMHNVLNALAAVVIGLEMGFSEKILKLGLESFKGVKRRFTKTGEVGGITVIDDYGHHPVEIAAVLSAARSSKPNRVIAVVQPHRYSRVKDLFDEFCTCFNDADMVIISDIYEAGETPIEGISKETLVEGLRRSGHRNVCAIQSERELPLLINKIGQRGDMVICLGAGTITNWANALPKQLADLNKKAS